MTSTSPTCPTLAVVAVGKLETEADLLRFVQSHFGDVQTLVRQLQGAVLVGEGDPEGVVPAKIGTLFRRTDGGASTVLYVKEADDGDPTGWQAK